MVRSFHPPLETLYLRISAQAKHTALFPGVNPRHELDGSTARQGNHPLQGEEAEASAMQVWMNRCLFQTCIAVLSRIGSCMRRTIKEGMRSASSNAAN